MESRRTGELIAIGRGELFLVTDKDIAIVTCANEKVNAALRADEQMRFTRELVFDGKTYVQFTAPADHTWVALILKGGGAQR
jgi:hypothetical protein